MSVEIVPIAEHHAESFRECLDAVAKEKLYLGQTEAPPIERVREFVRESIAEDVAQFVALDGDRVVGWCDIFPEWAHTLKHRGSVGMGVLAEYRGKGLGTALLSACLDKARANGLTRIELEVRADNDRAIGLYRRLGFEQEAVKRRAMRFDGDYYDSLTMTLLFDQEHDARR